jgi:hypothetical protein
MRPSNNTLASVGIGVPLATIIAWITGYYGVVMPSEVQAAVGAVISAIVGFFFDMRKAS